MASIDSDDKYKTDVSAYVVERPRYQVLAKIVERVLKRAAKEMGIEAIIQVRTKELASFAEKTIRKQATYPDPVNMMTDLCGARVITESTNEIPVVCEFIRRHFEIDEANTEDTVERLKISEFGYRSVHFIVSLRPGEFVSDVAEVIAEDSGAEPVVPYLDKRRTADECLGKPYGPGPRYRMEIQVRSLLQHAWANLYHDRVYKSEFKVPSDLQRELTRIAAILEDADENFARAIRTVDGYREYYGTYMPRERLNEEFDKQKRVREYDPGNRKLALKTARLAVVLERWDDVIQTLGDLVTRWQDLTVTISGVDKRVTEALDEALHRLEIAKTPAERRRALDALKAMRDAKAASLLLDYGTAKWRLEERETARLCLKRSIGLDLVSADARIALAETYAEEQDIVLALHWYTEAFDANPMEPRALRGFLHLTAEDERNLDFVELMHPTLQQVIRRCRERTAMGIYLPWAYYDIGFFRILLGEHYEGLGSYARAVELSYSQRPIKQALDAARGLVRALHRKPHPEWGWLERFLLLARFAKVDRLARDAESKAQGEQKPELDPLKAQVVSARTDVIDHVAERKCPPLKGKVVIVAGGCADEDEQRMSEYKPLLRTAFRDFAGTIFSGGTQSGISRLIGDLPPSSRGPIKKVACLPEHPGTWHQRHPGYEHYTHKGEGFTPLGAVQVWADILNAGIAPSDVRVLGISGGRYAGLEFRLGLMMGAKVGVLVGSGRAVDELLDDPDWNEHKNLVPLPYDPETVRVFVAGVSSQGIFSKDQREAVAEREHARSVEERKRKVRPDEDPANKPWDELRGDLKRSIRERVDSIGERLRAVGLCVVPSDSIPAGISSVETLDPEEIEVMAEMEHGRWNADKLLDGWRWGECKDDDEGTHPSLVPWATLPETEREKDRRYAREIPVVLKELGYAVVPMC